ncbi:MAG TPA: PIN domain-containing protein [Gemmatimonadaceae bacterium]
MRAPRRRARCALTSGEREQISRGLAAEQWLSLRETVLLPEPPGIDEILGAWSRELRLRAADWTDAYLAAFARAAACRIVAFDGDFKRYPGVDFLHLTS